MGKTLRSGSCWMTKPEGNVLKSSSSTSTNLTKRKRTKMRRRAKRRAKTKRRLLRLKAPQRRVARERKTRKERKAEVLNEAAEGAKRRSAATTRNESEVRIVTVIVRDVLRRWATPSGRVYLVVPCIL